MDATGSKDDNRAYYDAFSHGYERYRGDNDPGGYHEMLDELESEFVERWGRGRDVLEVGCGTGLVLSRIASFARSARGIDLSPGMLEKARGRGLDVVEGSATDLPFSDASFDVACSFKVLAHVPEVGTALREMTRVVRPGGIVIAEFYNPYSLRAAIKRFGPARPIADGADESHVYTRYDSPFSIRDIAPSDTELVDSRGVRIVTPTAHLMRTPMAARLFRFAERRLCDSPLRVFGGFWIAALRKKASA